MAYIYKIYNDVNDKVYIGQTRQRLNDRWYAHKYNAEHKLYDSVLIRAMNKYGIDKFHIEVIEECPIEELNNKEIYYIKQFNSVVPNGYNISHGGKGNQRYDYEEIISAYYASNKNITKTKELCNCSYSTIRTALDVYGIEANKTYTHLLTPILELNEKGEIIKRFENQDEVLNYYADLNMTRSGLRSILTDSGTMNTYKNKIFCRESEYDSYKKNHKFKDERKKLVHCNELNLTFNSGSEAGRWIMENYPENIQTTSVKTASGNILTGARKEQKRYGFTWSLID